MKDRNRTQWAIQEETIQITFHDVLAGFMHRPFSFEHATQLRQLSRKAAQPSAWS